MKDKKAKSVSFLMSENDNLVIAAKSIAIDYQIPLNSAIKVLFANLTKENERLSNELGQRPLVQNSQQNIVENVKVDKPQAQKTKSELKDIPSQSSTQVDKIVNNEKEVEVNKKDVSKENKGVLLSNFSSMFGGK